MLSEAFTRVIHKSICPLNTINKIDNALFKVTKRFSHFELRPYQRNVINKSIENFDNGITRQIVQLPVGSGKTVIFSHLIPEIPTRNDTGGDKVLILAHKIELLRQAQRTVQLVNSGLFIDLECGGSDASQNADVICASVGRLGRESNERLDQFEPDQFKAIIIDEAHRSDNKTYIKILKHFGFGFKQTKIVKEPGILLWGCSATAFRQDDKALGNIFEKIVHEEPMTKMVNENRICPVKYFYLTLDERHEKYKKRFVDTPERNQLIFQTYDQFLVPANCSSTLVFCSSIRHVERVVEKFNDKGINAKGITSETDSKCRDNIVEEFRNKEIPVLVNCEILTEGFDCPQIDSIILAKKTKSERVFQQIIGRGLRMHSNKKELLFFDVVRNKRLPMYCKADLETGSSPDSQSDKGYQDKYTNEVMSSDFNTYIRTDISGSISEKMEFSFTMIKMNMDMNITEKKPKKKKGVPKSLLKMPKEIDTAPICGDGGTFWRKWNNVKEQNFTYWDFFFGVKVFFVNLEENINVYCYLNSKVYFIDKFSSKLDYLSAFTKAMKKVDNVFYYPKYLDERQERIEKNAIGFNQDEFLTSWLWRSASEFFPESYDYKSIKDEFTFMKACTEIAIKRLDACDTEQADIKTFLLKLPMSSGMYSTNPSTDDENNFKTSNLNEQAEKIKKQNTKKFFQFKNYKKMILVNE